MLSNQNLCSPSEFSDDFLLRAGDITFARTGATVGKTYLYKPTPYRQYFAGYLIKFHFSEEIAKFVFYCTLSTRFKNWVSVYSKRSGQPGINSKEFSKYPIYLPSHDELSKITLFLDKIDKKISSLRNKIYTLKKYKEGFINQLVNNGNMGNKLVDYIEIESKTKFHSSYGMNSGKYPFFVNNSEGICKYCDYYSFDGSYLILNTGGCASVKLYQGKFSATADCLVIKPKRNLMRIYYFLKNLEKRLNYIGFQGTGLRHLDLDWLMRQKVRLPNVDEEKLQKITHAIDMQQQVYERKKNSLYKIKQFLLSNLFI